MPTIRPESAHLQQTLQRLLTERGKLDASSLEQLVEKAYEDGEIGSVEQTFLKELLSEETLFEGGVGGDAHKKLDAFTRMSSAPLRDAAHRFASDGRVTASEANELRALAEGGASSGEKTTLRAMLEYYGGNVEVGARETLSSVLTSAPSTETPASPVATTPASPGISFQDPALPGANTTSTTSDLALDYVNEYLLHQQEVFRGKDTRVDGKMELGKEISFQQPGGEPLQVDATFMKDSGLDAHFELKGDTLQLKESILEDGLIAPPERHNIAKTLVKLADQGFGVTLKDPVVGPRATDVILRKDQGVLRQTTHHHTPASNTRLHFDRGAELIPGATPPLTFSQAISAMNNPQSASEEGVALNGTLLREGLKLAKGETQTIPITAEENGEITIKLDSLKGDGDLKIEVGGETFKSENGPEVVETLTIPVKKGQTYEINVIGYEETEAALLVSGPKASEKLTFDQLNGMLHNAFEQEKASGAVAPDMSFTNYKMQFAQFDVPGVDESGVRWRDGDGKLNAPELAFLDLKVSDLPENEQHYFWTDLKWGEGENENTQMLVAFPNKEPTEADLLDILRKKGWGVDRLTKKEIGGHSYSLPGKSDLLPQLRDIPVQHLRTLMAGPDGKIQTSSGQTIDISSPESVKDLQALSAKTIQHNIMETALTSWAENSGESIGALLKRPLPDTQRVFLRQSNGNNNADTVGGHTIGQDSVVEDNMDTGAFGKCAPTAYFCGSITDIGVAAGDGLDKLKAAGIQGATELEGLLTKFPMDEQNIQAIHQKIDALRAEIRTQPELKTSVDHIEQLATSVVDRMVVKTDEEGPYMEMKFDIPWDALQRDSYMRGNLNYNMRRKSPPAIIKVRPKHIQEYLEQTNRSDDYRGGKQHMMDFFKDPSAMNNIELMRTMGPGIIAVGVDQALKQAGKSSGLLYGPGAQVVSSLVYNKNTRTGYFDLRKEIPHEVGSTEYNKAFEARRGSLVSMLKKIRDTGGSASVTMGFNSSNYHVNYLQRWGTPTIAGVQIPAEDISRCHMNETEYYSSFSAWYNDRASDTKINPEQMKHGLQSIHNELSAAGQSEKAGEVASLLELAHDVANTPSHDQEYLPKLRKAAASTMGWLKDNLTLENNDDTLNPNNVLLMPSNTERDDSVSDNRGDRGRVGSGSIGDQDLGSANANDASYFVPLNAVAGGWNHPDPEKVGETEPENYKHYTNDPKFEGFFPTFLSQIQTMYPSQW